MNHIDQLRLVLARTGHEDLHIALTQLVAQKLGREYTRDETHPVVDEIRSMGAGFLDVAGCLVDRQYSGRSAITHEHVKMALNSSELAASFDAAVATAMTSSTSDYIGRVTRLCREIIVDSFRETQSPIVSASDFVEVPPGGEIRIARATYSGEPVAVKSHPQNLIFSAESLLVGGRWGIVEATIDALGQAAGRHVNARMVELLGSNPTLSTGQAVFQADNDLPATALTVAGLDAAMGALSEQQTTHADENEGQTGSTGVEAANLVVPATLSATAHEIASELAPSMSLAVTPLPNLAGSWFLTGSKANSPWVMAKLSDSPINTQRIPAESQPLAVGDGTGFRVRLEYAIEYANRQICRVALP